MSNYREVESITRGVVGFMGRTQVDERLLNLITGGLFVGVNGQVKGVACGIGSRVGCTKGKPGLLN
jgi:hypothetical protein